MKYFVTGIICLVVALVFGLFCLVPISIPVGNQLVMGMGANITNAGASCGFAVAGGLCMIASAMSEQCHNQ